MFGHRIFQFSAGLHPYLTASLLSLGIIEVNFILLSLIRRLVVVIEVCRKIAVESSKLIII